MASQDPNTQAGATAQKLVVVPPMSVQQEDNIIHTRITNDEKALRRIAKKFHSYTTVACNAVPPSSTHSTSINDARDAFLIELASFHLSLKKSAMVCEAEKRQVEEYQRERQRIENERIRLRDQIEELKSSLEQAQLHRKRKMEYDLIAEKINALPSREELEESIKALENDMAAIRAEHENQDRILQAQNVGLSAVIASIQDLRTLGKQDIEILEEQDAMAAPEGQVTVEVDVDMDAPVQEETGEIKDDRADADPGKESDDEVPLAKKLLNPVARSFVPRSNASTPQPQSNAPTPTFVPSEDTREEGEDDDIEMGELAEEPKEKTPGKKKIREELEEGEASDMSSELSEIPSDID